MREEFIQQGGFSMTIAEEARWFWVEPSHYSAFHMIETDVINYSPLHLPGSASGVL